MPVFSLLFECQCQSGCLKILFAFHGDYEPHKVSRMKRFNRHKICSGKKNLSYSDNACFQLFYYRLDYRFKKKTLRAITYAGERYVFDNKSFHRNSINN